MRQSEREAIEWLRSRGITEEISIRQGSPDIILKSGQKYEVKRPVMVNTILLTQSQGKMFPNDPTIKFIVVDNRFGIREFENYSAVEEAGYRFHVEGDESMTLTTIKIDTSVRDLLKAHARKDQTYGEAILDLLEIAKSRRPRA